MSKPVMFAVHVQHPAIDDGAGGSVPNFIFLGTVLADDELTALAEAQAVFGESHAVNLITVEPLED